MFFLFIFWGSLGFWGGIFYFVFMLYTHLQHHNDTIIKTQWQRQTQEVFFNIILPLTLLQGFEKVVWGFTVRGCWRPNINCNILTTNLLPSLCVFLVLLMLGSTLLGAGFLYCILSASSPDLNSSRPKGPFGLMWLSLSHLHSNWLQLYWPPGRRTQLEPELNSTGSSNSTELYNRSTPTRSLKSNV